MSPRSKSWGQVERRPYGGVSLPTKTCLHKCILNHIGLRAPMRTFQERLSEDEEIKMEEMGMQKDGFIAVGNAKKEGKCIEQNPDDNVFTGGFDVIIDMDWLRRCHAVILSDEKLVQIPYGNETLTFCGNESSNRRESRLIVISCSKAQQYMAKGCQVFLRPQYPQDRGGTTSRKEKTVKDVPIVRDFLESISNGLANGLLPAD
ncbi:hypothetical protein Tco_0005510 [Tanacetum coccineum]